MIIRNLLTIFLILFSLLGFGQNFKQEKRIYMLDITKSMWGSNSNTNIFNDVKNALYKGIDDINDPETIITIIPFQATHTYEILPNWTFKAGDKKTLNTVKKHINSYDKTTVPGGYTDIYSALETAKKNIDPDKINYIFLLTDGEQSAIPSATKKTSKIDFSEKHLKKSLSNWCDFSSNKEVHLFYVMLSEDAVNKSIVETINKECNAYAVQGTNMNIAFIKPITNTVKINLHDNPSIIEIGLVANNWTYLKDNTLINLELQDNQIFETEVYSVKIENKTIRVKLKNKSNLSLEDLRNNNEIETNLKLILTTGNELKILNPNINIVVRNKKERILTLEFSSDE